MVAPVGVATKETAAPIIVIVEDVVKVSITLGRGLLPVDFAFDHCFSSVG